MNTEYSDIINNFIIKALSERPTINIVGDCMLDINYQVRARYNPEANFPAYTVMDKAVVYPGGAGNIAYCLSEMPLKYRLYGSLDKEALDAYDAAGVKTKYCKNDSHTPRKQRYYNDGTLFQRIDLELNRIKSGPHELKEANLTLFSDYDKGTFDTLWFKSYLKGAVVDAKPNKGLTKWHGCRTIKMNKKESHEATRAPSINEQCNIIYNLTHCEDIVITKGKDGVFGRKSVRRQSQEDYVVRETVNCVKTVIGAGDCFSGFYAYAMALGYDSYASSVIATRAASVYVTQMSRRPIKLLDLINDKVVPCSKLLRNRDFRLVFTNGCFDILHAGHIECLRFAKSKGDKLVVALNSDESVNRLKGDGRPVNNISDRIRVISALQMVDYVIVFDDDTPYDIIKKIKPDALVKGSPYTIDTIVGSDIVKDTFVFDNYNGLSSTALLGADNGSSV